MNMLINLINIHYALKHTKNPTVSADFCPENNSNEAEKTPPRHVKLSLSKPHFLWKVVGGHSGLGALIVKMTCNFHSSV